ncbi:RNA polymerase sigma factor [Desulfobacter latus]|uniref:RNA polymerase sigma factor n=1 Tax=Desulfobacter latus TaxID=2292 RepID=A0A850STW8_9BACT|nr:RNA polymerase sigma factor [Desulfobacter latus]NWH04804.1 RNA polymerase sigma factor [Desulfobacter latus]
MPDIFQQIPQLLANLESEDIQVDEQLWKTMMQSVYMVTKAVSRKMGTQQKIDDIVQVALISLLKHEDLCQVRNWKRFLYTVVTNASIDIQRLKRERVGQDPSLDAPIGDSDGKNTTFIEITADEHWNLARIHQSRKCLEFFFHIISTMPKERQQPFRLYLLGHTQKQIALLVGLPVTTINNYIHKAKQSVKKVITTHQIKLEDMIEE